MKNESAARTTFPGDEEKHPWLPLLLEAGAVIDRGVGEALRLAEEESGRALACRKGCDVCCRIQRDIPAYPHELTGIYWYCSEKLRQPTREVLRLRLAARRAGDPCPFLMEGACVIHPLRPAGCRQFNVLGERCAEGEDPFHTRREDVVSPPREVLRKAFGVVLPFYVTPATKKAKKEIIEKIIHTQVISITEVDWRKLAERMAGGAGR